MRPQSSATTYLSIFTKQVEGINLDNSQMGRAGRRPVDGIVSVAGLQLLARLDRQRSHVRINRLCDLLERHRAIGSCDGGEAAIDLDIVGTGFEQMRGDLLDFLAQDPRGVLCRTSAQNRAAAGIGSGRHRHRIAVALHDADILKFRAEIVGDDLGERRLQPLPVRGDAKRRGYRAGRSRGGSWRSPSRC